MAEPVRRWEPRPDLGGLCARVSSRRHFRRTLLFFFLLAASAVLTGCAGERPPSGLLSLAAVLGGRHVFAAGDRVPGDVYVFSGELATEPGASVGGSLLVLGGDVRVDGSVEGDVSVLGGRLALGPTSIIGGELTLAGGELERSPQAVVSGGIHEADATRAAASSLAPGPGDALASVIPALLIALLAYLLARYLPGPLGRVTEALVRHPIVSLSMGILAGTIGLVLLVLIAFTVILIPVSLAGGGLLLVSIACGWAGFGMALGRLLTRHLPRRLAPPPAAFLGTLLFMLGMRLLGFLPLLGGIIPLLAAATGLGAVILTRFGWHTFVPAADEAPDLLPSEELL